MVTEAGSAGPVGVSGTAATVAAGTGAIAGSVVTTAFVAACPRAGWETPPILTEGASIAVPKGIASTDDPPASESALWETTERVDFVTTEASAASFAASIFPSGEFVAGTTIGLGLLPVKTMAPDTKFVFGDAGAAAGVTAATGGGVTGAGADAGSGGAAGMRIGRGGTLTEKSVMRPPAALKAITNGIFAFFCFFSWRERKSLIWLSYGVP